LILSIYTEFTASSANCPVSQGANDMSNEGNKDITIVVNGTQKTVQKDRYTFDEIVKLAYEQPPYGDNTLFSITYRRGHGNKEGVLDPGKSIELVNGMIFDVTPTDKS
jgi:hypothetical protein